MKTILFTIGFMFVMAYSHGSQQQLPDSVLQSLNSLSNKEKVQYLGDLCWKLNEKSNTEAIIYGKYAIQLADSLGFYSEASEISNYLGVAMLYYVYDTKQAWIYFRNALDYAVNSKDSIQIAYSYDNIAYMYLLYGDLYNARFNIKNAHQIFKSLRNDRGLAYSLTTVGLIYQADKNYKEALNCFYKSKELHTSLSNETGIIASLSCIGSTLVLINELDSAYSVFENQLSMSRKINHKKYIASALRGIGEVFFERGMYVEALEKVNMAMDIVLEKNDYFGLVDVYIDRALIYSQQEFKNKAENELHLALETAKKLGFPKEIYKIFEAYSKFYKRTDIPSNSALVFQNLFMVYDSLYQEHQIEAFKNEYQKNEISRSLGKMKNDLLLRKNREIYLYIIISLFGIIGLILYGRYRSHRAMNKKLNEVNMEVLTEVEKKNKALKALSESELELQQINTTKDKFFSIIAHDLKSPFNAILGYSELLYEKDTDYSSEEKEEMAKKIYMSSKRTFNLLENLLIWAQTQTNRIEFTPKEHDITTLIDDNVLLYKGAATKKGIEINFKPDGPNIANCDRAMINTVLRNLISNALKFTPKGGKIHISVSEKEKSLEIVVSDTGVGIPQNLLDKLFLLDNEHTALGTEDENGTGLGLHLCKDFVEMHGGKIWVESTVDKGTSVYFTLPV